MEKEIVFEELDTPTTTAIKTVNLWVGTSELKPQLAKLGITYTKIYRGLNTYYCLKGREIGSLRIKL